MDDDIARGAYADGTEESVTRPGDRFEAECDAVEQRISALLERRTRQLMWLLLPLYGVFLAMVLVTLLVRW